MTEDNTPHEWGAYRRLILDRLDRIDRDTKAFGEKLDRYNREFLVELATIKEKARIWGFLGGLIASGLVAVIVQIAIRSFVGQ